MPQGFNYQAIARNATGLPITNQVIPVRISIVTALTSGTVIWQEEHSSVTADQFGMISLVVGTGTQTGGSATSFSAINWSAQTLFLKTEVKYPGPGWTDMGTSQIWAVPYSLTAKEVTGPLTKLGITGTTTDMEEALFEVKNQAGNTVFAVYNEGIRAYVGNGDAKGKRGGFAVGGYDATKGSGTIYDLFTLNTDSARIYVDSKPNLKGARGGFSVGGYDMTKGGVPVQNYLDVSNDSVRIYIDSNPLTKGKRGGFAVGGYDMTKGTNDNYLNVNTDATGIINPVNRILWYPIKNAFLTGRVLVEKPDSVGTNSFASGYESKAIGQYSQALGYKAVARGDYSTAIGKNALANKINSFAFGDSARALNLESYAIGRGAIASGYRSFAFGSAGIDSAGHPTDVARALGDYSFAIGQGSQTCGLGSFAFGIADTAKGKYAIAMGYKTSARGAFSTAMGLYTTASELYSTAMGGWTIASGTYSTAMGMRAIASGDDATAMGHYSTASGAVSTAMGYTTTASGIMATAIGGYTTASGNFSLAWGDNTKAIGTCSMAMGESSVASGNFSTAIGDGTIANGVLSTAMGYMTTATGSYSTSMGNKSMAKGDNSFAIGIQDTASGYGSTVTGLGTKANNYYSIATGEYTTASGSNSTAIGGWTTASGDFSIAFGYMTKAPSGFESVFGANNTSYTPLSTTGWNPSDRLFVIGNGGFSTPSNAVTVLKNGCVGLQSIISPTYALQLPNSATVTIGTGRAYAWTTYSDSRLKENQMPLSYGLREVMELSPKQYVHHSSIDQSTWGKENIPRTIGLIAQEVYDIIPEAVDVPENSVTGLWGLNYDKLIPVLVKAIQEQQTQIESYKSENDNLKSQVQSLQGKAEQIETQQKEIDELKALVNSLITSQTTQMNKE